MIKLKSSIYIGKKNMSFPNSMSWRPLTEATPGLKQVQSLGNSMSGVVTPWPASSDGTTFCSQGCFQMFLVCFKLKNTEKWTEIILIPSGWSDFPVTGRWNKKQHLHLSPRLQKAGMVKNQALFSRACGYFFETRVFIISKFKIQTLSYEIVFFWNRFMFYHNHPPKTTLSSECVSLDPTKLFTKAATVNWQSGQLHQDRLPWAYNIVM